MVTIKIPDKPLRGSLVLPGSKSISNRVLLLSHQTGKRTKLHHVSESEDSRLLIRALEKIKPQGEAIIDVHHAGSDLRFLSALLAVTPGLWTLTGSDRLRERPIADLLKALRMLGADISGVARPDHLPLLIRGKKLPGGPVRINASLSSQFLSALLLIAPSLSEGINIQVEGKIASRSYADMTLALLRQFGVEVTSDPEGFKAFYDRSRSAPEHFTVESDWSAASYWYSFCALLPGARISLSQLQKESLQPDSVLPELYRSLGVDTEWINDGVVLRHTGERTKAFSYDFSSCPDIAQTLAVTCFALGAEARLTGLGTLRHKETDRISAIKTELTKFGAQVSCGDDYLHIEKREQSVLTGVSPIVETYSDHRMAMSFASLATVFPGMAIAAPDVVAKSYPGFWNDLQSLGFNVNLRP